MTTTPAYTIESVLQAESRHNANEPTSMEESRHKRILLLIRILFLSLYAAMGSIQPFLPIYYLSLGHSGLVVGVLGAIRPLVTCLVLPLWGILADKTQNPNRHGILKIAFFGWVFFQLSMAFRDCVSYLMGIVFITSVFQAPIKGLVDSLVMDQLTKNDQYGRLRLFGQLGYGLGISAIGLVLSRSHDNGTGSGTPESSYSEGTSVADAITAASWTGLVQRPCCSQSEATLTKPTFIVQRMAQSWQTINLDGYRLAFCAFGALSALSWLCIYTLVQVTSKKNDRVVTKPKKEQARIKDGLVMLVQNRHALLFLFLVFVVGVSTGCTENFAYVRMKEVGASSRDIGFSRLLGSAAGATMFWFAGSLTQRLGHVRVLVLTPLFYASRFFIYGYMTEPCHALPAELMRGVSFAAFWSTATTYSQQICPPGMNTTMLMFLNAMYQGLGPSIGAVVFGKLQSVLGTADAFVFMGTCNVGFVTAMVTGLGIRDADLRTRWAMKTGSGDSGDKAKIQ